MEATAVAAIYPTSPTNGSLTLSNNINNPEFIASLLQLYECQHYVFGLCVTLYALIFYFVKAVVVDP
jgi:hypothetical protein